MSDNGISVAFAPDRTFLVRIADGYTVHNIPHRENLRAAIENGTAVRLITSMRSAKYTFPQDTKTHFAGKVLYRTSDISERHLTIESVQHHCPTPERMDGLVAEALARNERARHVTSDGDYILERLDAAMKEFHERVLRATEGSHAT